MFYTVVASMDTPPMSQTILYARVSTSEQTIDHQEAQTRAAGFTIDHVVADHGVSGVAVKLTDRPNGKRLFDMLRRGDTLVVRWIDRLGRDYSDVTETIRTLMKRGVVVRTIINSMTFDGVTEDPVQMAVRDALIGFMAATAKAQGEATRLLRRLALLTRRSKGDRLLIGAVTRLSRETTSLLWTASWPPARASLLSRRQ